MKKAFPILGVLTAILLVYALYQALVVAPTEQTMGAVQRIFYYHVPSAWTAFLLFFINFGASVVLPDQALRHGRYCRAGVCRSGRGFLHGRADHGADLGASGVGHLVDVGHAADVDAGAVADLRELFFLRRFSSGGQTPLLAAALAVLGALCVPFVYFSIWFFRTQHPQPVMGGGGSIDPRMMHVLLINWLAFSCFAFLVCWSRYRLEKLSARS
jgi:heme exporter protein C